MATNIQKTDTLKLRIDAATLGLLDRASTYAGLNKSKFIRQSIREKAEAVIAEHDKTCFTTDDWLGFFDMLDNPPEPTLRMKKAAKKYQGITSPNGV